MSVWRVGQPHMEVIASRWSLSCSVIGGRAIVLSVEGLDVCRFRLAMYAKRPQRAVNSPMTCSQAIEAKRIARVRLPGQILLRCHPDVTRWCANSFLVWYGQSLTLTLSLVRLRLLRPVLDGREMLSRLLLQHWLRCRKLLLLRR